MALFTFNFDQRIKWFLLTFIIGTGLFALYNFAIWKIEKDDPGGEFAAQKFWIDKIYPTKKYNAVFLGDSRCMNGINPAHLEEKLGKPAFNSGFLSGGINKIIFEHVETKLLSTSPDEPRCVVLSVTPVTISNIGAKNEHFFSLFKTYKTREIKDPEFLPFVFKKLNLKEIGILFGRGLSRSICHENGWHELNRKIRMRSHRRALRYYGSDLLKRTHISQKNIDEILEQTGKWKKKNITVFAFYIPSSTQLQALEEAVPNWDMKKFKSQLESAGGVYLEIPERETYVGYDAVHLASADAERLSKVLAEQICSHFDRQKATQKK